MSRAGQMLPLREQAGGTDGRGASIQFRDVGYVYPTGLQAVRGLNLDIAAGKSVGIVGPSGCGKSTVLSLIAKLRKAQEGSVEVHKDATDRHLLSMIFQKDTVLPWRTVEQNVRLHYSFRKAPRDVVDERVKELIELVHLGGFEKSYPYELSGGMRRRVALLTAVAPLPQVLLLDEPFSAIDEPSRMSIHQDVFELVRKLGITMVLVTHDLAEAASLCDEVHIMAPRPTYSFKKHTMPFGPERDMFALRENDAFLSVYGELWRDLHQQIESERTDEQRAN